MASLRRQVVLQSVHACLNQTLYNHESNFTRKIKWTVGSPALVALAEFIHRRRGSHLPHWLLTLGSPGTAMPLTQIHQMKKTFK
jgi:hypothetical protein